jgi:hypothetical protein
MLSVVPGANNIQKCNDGMQCINVNNEAATIFYLSREGKTLTPPHICCTQREPFEEFGLHKQRLTA